MIANVFDNLIDVADVWAGAFGEVFFGTIPDPILPTRYHVLIGPALTQYEIHGPRAGYTAIIGPGRGPYTLEG